jgi:hypothetical protein
MVRSWHARDLISKAAVLTEADAPETQGISLPDLKATFGYVFVVV